MATARHKHGTAALSGALALAALLAGCGGGSDGNKAPAAVTAAPSPTRSADPDAAEKAAVLEAYRKMTDAEARTYATAKLDPALEKYAAHKALADIKVTLFYQQQQGTVMRGTVTRSPKVTVLDTESTPLKAVVSDCADSSTYNEVDVDSGKTLPYTGARRHVVTSSAERSKTGAWKIYTYVIERDRTC